MLARGVGRSGQPAFALIELVVLLVISGVVVSLAVSAYRTYSIRAEVADGLLLAAGAERLVVNAFRHNGEPPADVSMAGLRADVSALQSRFVESLNIVNGRIDLTYGNAANPAVAGAKLSLTPYETADLDVVWICGNEIPGRGLQPLGFAGGTRQAVQIPSTIEARYLPSTCR